MRHLRRAALVAAVGSCVVVAPAAAQEHAAPRTERVSVSAGGAQSAAETGDAQLSGDGRFVVLHSMATDLVPGTADPQRRIYVKELRTGKIELVSVASNGTQADGPSWSSSISADGRYVVFDSEATNLAPGRNPGGYGDVFVRDRQTGRTEVLVENKGTQPAHSSSPSISADGRYVAFASNRSDLVPGDTNDTTDVFVRDRLKGTTERVSVTSDGAQGDGFSVSPVISADGSTVGFRSLAQLAPEPPGERAGLRKPQARTFYAHDLRTGRTQLAAQRLDGGPAAVLGAQALSPDGRYALFSSASAGVVAGDTNGKADAFAKDLRTGVTRRLSLAADGSQADGASGDAVLSADSRRVFFTSDATNLVPGDTNGASDVFARDLLTGAVERVSLAHDGSQGNGRSAGPGTDLAGRTLVFTSAADNLVPGDTNAVHDAFVRHLK
ncbi:TolB family protein [Streptomyces cinnamoneus]|uniref:Uncharacterized protein n=1 Tax=Streptomyces cinnamoneus TaxID=53446 RepID=A0A918TX53_STRCJ|nr:PD40 domain-containing protein [Streptomyces cinnamoneus]GHC60601.1 hypothetical protein GCM10010507_41990 [Streptomyces cinnamoneus]